MKLQLVPAGTGAQWVRQGFGVFFARPLAFFSLFGALLLSMLLAGLLPWVGPPLFLAWLPLFSLGFMLATEQVLNKRPATLQVFVAPLQVDRARTRSLWRLGLLYAVLMIAAAYIRVWIDGGRSDELQALIASGKAAPERLAELVSDPRLQLGLLWFALAAGLISLPFWHAPALIHWGALPWAKAMFFSSVACWRNKAAFAVYGLTWLAVVVAFAFASSMVLALLGQPQWVALAMTPGVLIISTVFYASLYFSFAACFEMPAPGEDAAPR